MQLDDLCHRLLEPAAKDRVGAEVGMHHSNGHDPLQLLVECIKGRGFHTATAALAKAVPAGDDLPAELSVCDRHGSIETTPVAHDTARECEIERRPGRMGW